MTESCTFTFEQTRAADGAGTRGTTAGDGDDRWECPHDVHPGADRCPFHLAPDRRAILGLDDAAVRDAFLDAIEGGTRERRSFVGARFGTLDLSARRVDAGDRSGIDLRHAEIEHLDLTRAVVAQPLRLAGADVGRIDARNAAFDGGLSLRGLELGDEGAFAEAEFDGAVDCEDATFDGTVGFRNATFDERVTFDRTAFEEAVFTEVTFDDDVAFRGARFAGDATFAGTEFTGGANVEADDADFSGATFEASASFEMAQFRAGTFAETTFAAETSFERAVFRRDTTFTDTTFDGPVDVTRGTFEGNVAFERGAFAADTTFEEVDFAGDAVFVDATFEGPVSFAGGEFHGGSNLLVDDADFSGVWFHAAADFHATRFRYAGFADARFAAAADFADATFERGGTFAAADFEADLTVADCRFEGTADFTEATIAGDLDLDETVCTDDATFTAVQVGGDASVRGVEFRGGANVAVDDADFSRVTVEGTFDCENAFFRWARFDDARFRGSARFPDATFERGCSFVGASVGGEFDCYRARVVGEADFTDAAFAGVRFDETVFEDDASFASARFDGDASFRGVEFRGGANVVVDDADFSAAVFAAPATFRDAVFRYGRFDGATFHEPPTFDAATFRKGAAFDGTTLPASASFRDVYVERGLDFEPTPAGDHALVDMTDADVDHGTIARPSAGGVFYDMTSATLGTVELVGSDADHETPLFDHFLFNGTEFEDFDFSRHRGYLERNEWQIHRLDDAFVDAATGEAHHQFTPQDLESTYLKAKNGASAAGDNKANSEFFRKEMAYRRRQYLDVLRGRTNGGALSRPRALAKWSINAFFDATCGYGERPLRVVAVSILLICVFTLPYALLGVDIADSNVADPFVYSLQSFTSLVLDPPRGANALVNTLTAVEGFVGGFFIALFVFSLTRSLHR